MASEERNNELAASTTKQQSSHAACFVSLLFLGKAPGTIHKQH